MPSTTSPQRVLCLSLASAVICYASLGSGASLVEKTPLFPSPVPDTGQTSCYDTKQVIACPGPGEDFYGQDANYSINTPAFDTLKQGRTEIITDKITGLMWQGETDNITRNWSQAIDYTEEIGLAGYDDWRLPTKIELQTILSYGNDTGPLKPPSLLLDETASAAPRTCAWTISNRAFPSLDAKMICFPDKQGASAGKFDKHFVFGVRGPSFANGQFTDNGRNTISDNGTGLMWQSTEIRPLTWKDALSYCENLELGGFKDWRLPTVKELSTLVDESKDGPAMDTDFFPAARPAAYWTSTTFSGRPAFAWYIRFDHGLEHNGGYKERRYFVRAVRNILPPQPDMEKEILSSPAVSQKPELKKAAVSIVPVIKERKKERIKTPEIKVPKVPPVEKELDIYEPYPLDYRLYEE